jgi:hypothetical protein
MTFIIDGPVNVEVTMVETEGGSIEFTLRVLDDTGSIGDLNGLFFDLANDSLTSGLSVTGDDITGAAFKANSISKIDSYNNLNGEVINELGRFDGGVQFGTAGIGTDDIRVTTFTLTHADQSLSLADFALQDFGVRLTSVGAEDGSRDGSLKLGGTAPEVPSDVIHLAIDDSLTVEADEGFDPDSFEFLDSGSSTVLANDLTDTDPYGGLVLAANGDTGALGQVIVGDNGGYMIIYADGTVDFSASSPDGINDFSYLDPGMSADTHFNYTIEGGSTATITVTVFGLLDGGGGIDLTPELLG